MLVPAIYGEEGDGCSASSARRPQPRAAHSLVCGACTSIVARVPNGKTCDGRYATRTYQRRAPSDDIRCGVGNGGPRLRAPWSCCSPRVTTPWWPGWQGPSRRAGRRAVRTGEGASRLDLRRRGGPECARFRSRPSSTTWLMRWSSPSPGRSLVRGSPILEQDQVLVMHIQGGKIAEVWLQFSDQQAMDEFASS